MPKLVANAKLVPNAVNAIRDVVGRARKAAEKGQANSCGRELETGWGLEMSPKDPNEIDRLVGSRIRVRRMQVGMSQDQLGTMLGVTVPQVQKYEKGVNRVGASRLHKVAGILDVPISYFFEAPGGLDIENGGEGIDPSVFADRETVEVAIAFNRIKSPELRRAFLDLARVAALSAPGSDDPNDVDQA